MTETVLVNSAVNVANDTIEKLYDSPSGNTGASGTLITAFTATNNSGANASYKAYIYDVSGALLQAVMPQTIVVRNKFSLGPAAVGQLIPAGGSLRTETSTAGAIAFRVTGDEL